MGNTQVIIRKKNKELNISTDNESMLERLAKYYNLLFQNKLKDIKEMNKWKNNNQNFKKLRSEET